MAHVPRKSKEKVLIPDAAGSRNGNKIIKRLYSAPFTHVSCSVFFWFGSSKCGGKPCYGQLHTFIILKYRCWNCQEIGVVASSVVNHMLWFINFLVSKIRTGTSSYLRLLDASFSWLLSLRHPDLQHSHIIIMIPTVLFRVGLT